MSAEMELFYEKQGKLLVKNLQSRHFDAYYCKSREEALKKALSLITDGASVGWGGALSAQQIGLIDAIRAGNFQALDRDAVEDRDALMLECLRADVFLTGANGLSLDGQMVNIDGTGNRVAAISYGPKSVIVIVGMNKVTRTVEDAVQRARNLAAPLNQQRFLLDVPCTQTGACSDCKSAACICNQILVTRHCRPAGRIKFILVGEPLGL